MNMSSGAASQILERSIRIESISMLLEKFGRVILRFCIY